MGCGSSKQSTADAHRATSRRYLNYAGGQFEGDGGAVYLPSTGPLTAKEYKERLTTSEGTQTVYLPGAGYTIRYAYVSQRGYYPDSPDKLNQDAFCVHTYFGGERDQHFFGVFDGHGEFGTPAAQFARDKVRARGREGGRVWGRGPEGLEQRAREGGGAAGGGQPASEGRRAWLPPRPTPT